MNAAGYYQELEDEKTAPERITIPPEVLARIARSAKPAPVTPPASEQILDAVAVDVTPPAPAQLPTPTPEPAPVADPEFPESDKCRKWFEDLDLATVYDEQTTTAEFYKHSVSVFNAGPDRQNRYYLITKSPQQKSWSRRALGKTLARGNTKDELKAGLDHFLAERERKETARRERVAANRAARAEFVNPYKVGDFLYSSWGYDQTNREFYQILETRPTAIKVREVCQERTRDSYDSGRCSPIRDSFVKDETERWITIQIDARYNNHSIPSPIHGNLYLWDGQPVYFSDGH